jgi:hypothetical protein
VNVTQIWQSWREQPAAAARNPFDPLNLSVLAPNAGGETVSGVESLFAVAMKNLARSTSFSAKPDSRAC